MPRVFLIKKKRDVIACMTSADAEAPARGDDESRENTNKDADDDSGSETAGQQTVENDAELDTHEGVPSPVQHELTEDTRAVDQSKPEFLRDEMTSSRCVLSPCPLQPAPISLIARDCVCPSDTKGNDITLTSTRQTPSPQLQPSPTAVSSPFSSQRSPPGLHHSSPVPSPKAELEGSRVAQRVPCKRHSDFSAEFLLSRDAGRRPLLSTVSPITSPRQPSEMSVDKVCDDDQRLKAHVQLPCIPSPAKCTAPCLSVSSWLESSLPVPTPYSASDASPSPSKRTKGRNGLSSSPEADRLGQTCARLTGLNRFQDHGEHEGFSAFTRTTKDEVGYCGRSFAPFASKPIDKRSSETTRRDSRVSQLEGKVPSPPLLPREKFPMTASHRGRLLLGSSSSSSSSSSSCLLPPTTLSLGNLPEQRRGSSTSPAHSERTSSGSDSPPTIFDGSPTHQHPPPPHFADELPWSHVSAAVPDPFVQSALGPVSPHHLLSMGLPYLQVPGLGRSLSDLGPSHGYGKSATDSLTSAFKSTRHPFLHPVVAAAAYYSNLRSSLPFPFSFPAAGGGAEVTRKPLGEKVQTPLLEHVDVLRARHRLHLDPMAGFPPSTPLSPTSAGLNGRPASVTPTSRDGGQVGGRKKELADHPSASSFGAHSGGIPGVGMPADRVLSRGKELDSVRYQCEACSKSYSTFSGLSKHKQFHCAAQVKKEFSCKYCDKTYVSLGALKMHIRTHTLPCKCGVCGKAFSRPWLLQGHVRTHTGEKPFTCPHCARAFADRSNLRAHLQTHSDVKKYSCRACSKTFSRMSLLLKHEDGCCSGMV